MPGNDCAGERVVVGRCPTEVCDRRADDQGSVGDPSGDDDLRTGAQALGDAERAEIGVRRERFAEAEFGAARAQIVALDVRDADIEAE